MPRFTSASLPPPLMLETAASRDPNPATMADEGSGGVRVAAALDLLNVV